MHSTRATLLKLAFSFVLLLVGLELTAYLYFSYLMPSSEKRDLLFGLYGVKAGAPKESLPSIMPYLWSNYRPYPGTLRANEYGWRYGGGPKKGDVRILCMGGSTTWSQGASSPANSYPAKMEAFLKKRGFSVDVVNGGCPYYTTAEMIGALAFRGIYTDPDIVLIHEGFNDTHPLMSPREYLPDYSHWRTADPSENRLALLRQLWRVPLFTIRMVAWKTLRPDPFGRQSLGVQTDTPQEALLATNDITRRVNTGYRRNLITLASIARGHGATPIFITFNLPKGRLSHLCPQMTTDPALAERVEKRARWAMDHNNSIMTEVGRDLSIPVIPFHEWAPSRDELWVDSCHLNDEGCEEKAKYIGEWLVEKGYIQKR